MSTSLLSATPSPTSFPPVTRLAIAPGRPFLSSTPATIFVTAMEHSDVVGDGFHIVALPAAIEIERFLTWTSAISTSLSLLEVSSPAVDRDGKVEGGEHAEDAKWVRDCQESV